MQSLRVLAPLATATIAVPADAASSPVCGFCGATSEHSCLVDAPPDDTAVFAVQLKQGSSGPGAMTAGGTTALSTSYALAEAATQVCCCENHF